MPIVILGVEGTIRNKTLSLPKQNLEFSFLTIMFVGM